MIHNERINIIISETGARTVKREIDAMGAIAQRSNNRLMYWISILKDNIALLGLAATAAGAALAGLGFALFERNMLAVQVATQATAEQIRELSRTARETGLAYGVMANEVALGMDSLARAGVSAQALQEGAMEAALVLARATGAEIEDGAGVAANAMQVYGIAAEDMMRVVQGGAAVINLTTHDLNDYRLAIANAGLVARGMGVEFEDFNAVLAATASGFSSGATQGTTFKTFLQRLAPSSAEARRWIEALTLDFWDANGELRDMADIADELNRVFGSMSTEDAAQGIKEVFGADAYQLVVNLMAAGGDTIRRYRDEIIPATDATEMARVRMQGLAGAFFYALAALEEFAIEVMDSGWGRAFEVIIRGMADAILWLGRNLDHIEPLVAAIGTMFAIHWGGKAVRWIMAADGAMAFFGRRMNWVTSLLSANPWLLVAGAIVGVGVALYNLTDELTVTEDGLVTVRDAAGVVWDDIVAGAGDMAGEVLGLFRDMSRGTRDEMDEIGDESQDVWDWALEQVQGFVVMSVLALFKWKAQVGVLWQEVRNIFDGDGLNMENLSERLLIAGAQGLREGAEYIRSFEARARERAGQRERAEEAAQGPTALQQFDPNSLTELPDISNSSGQSPADILREFNEELDINTRLLSHNVRERHLWAEIERLNQQMTKAGRALSADERADAIERLRLLEQETLLQDERDRIYEEQIGTALDLQRTQSVLNELYQRGAITLGYLNAEMRRTNMTLLELKINSGQGTFADGFLLELNRMLQGVENFRSSAGQIFGEFYSGMVDGFADSVGRAIAYGDDLGESLMNVARSAVAELISALVKLGIQWLINATLGETIAASSTAATAAMGGTVAAAWAPAAAAVSLATYGANAGPAMLGIGMTYALTEALSMVSGFRDGGYVSGPGSGTSDSILARLSNGEYVMNANATRQHRATLEAMNAGRSTSSGGDMILTMNPQIVIQGSGTEAESARNGRAAAQAFEAAFVAMVKKHRQHGGVLN